MSAVCLPCTLVHRSHMIPELPLYLLTPSCRLYTAKEGDLDLGDPWWAIFWPGGQVSLFPSGFPKVPPMLPQGARQVHPGPAWNSCQEESAWPWKWMWCSFYCCKEVTWNETSEEWWVDTREVRVRMISNSSLLAGLKGFCILGWVKMVFVMVD